MLLDDRKPAGNPLNGLKLLSFNIQTGIDTSHPRHYLTRSWQHILPTRRRQQNLDRIADFVRNFDIVGLQEVDGGGMRSRSIVQTEYLARNAGFKYWYNQINRRVGRVALHSNGLLSRMKPSEIMDLKLPGIPGRGALLVRFGDTADPLHLCVAHLALGRRARIKQIEYLIGLVGDLPNLILMGDLNFETNTPEMNKLISGTQLCRPVSEIKTFPSWRPKRRLDHILVTSGLSVQNIRVPRFACSDHLPVAMEIALPQNLTVFDGN